MNRRLPIRRGGTGDRAGRSPSRWRKRLRTAVIAMVVAVIAISAVTARLFVWPDHGMPARVSAIVVLDRPVTV